MHQSPQKQLAGRRDKFADYEMADTPAERKAQRGAPPKARKFPQREESPRVVRWDKLYSGR
jgi:hypothetical protein